MEFMASLLLLSSSLVSAWEMWIQRKSMQKSSEVCVGLRVRNSGFCSSPVHGLTQNWAGQEGVHCIDPDTLPNTLRIKGTPGVGEHQLWGFAEDALGSIRMDP